MSIFSKIKELLAGWSVWTLAKKLVGRAVPVATAGAVTFLSKWAPESAADENQVKTVVAFLIWAALESARNAVMFAINKRGRK